MRLAAYAGASTALAAGVILKALHQRANFYSACVYLSQSNANLMILTNFCLLIVGFVLYGLQRLLYGPLRPVETEQLYEKAWFAVTETCLAMTIFRGEMGAWFLVMFVCLLVGKIWGWIGEGRVEILEQQPPQNPRLFHTRLAVSLILAVVFNTLMLEYAVKTVLRKARPDMMVMFGFEFAILSILSTSTAARYGISLWEIYITRQQRQAKMEERRAEIRAARAEAIQQQSNSGSQEPLNNLPNEDDIDEMELDVPGWEEKGRWVFYLNIVTDFVKLVVYMSFFAILFTFYGLPIHIIRDVVLTMRSFGKRVVDFLRYRNATRDMHQRYPDATAEEIAAGDVCIICREEMEPWQPAAAPNGNAPPARPSGPISDRLRAKKLPCGHILHFACLRSWLERQQICPTCRRPVASARIRQDFVAAPGVAPGGPGGMANQAQGAGANQTFGAADGQPGEARPRAWMFNFGPIRVGFGAGRGDLFQNLAQQIHDGQAPPVQPGANANRQPAGPQQIGFGFGFGRPPAQQPLPAQHNNVQPTASNTQFNFQHTQAHLQHVEHHISQAIDNLRATAEQLQVVRLLQAELARLRATQASMTNQHTQPQPQPQPQAATAPAITPTAMASSHIPATGSQRQFTSHPQVPALGSGDSRLPEGLILPRGWTLLPLQQANHPGPSSTQTSTTHSMEPPFPSHSSSMPSTQLFSQTPNTSSPPTNESTNSAASLNHEPLDVQRSSLDSSSPNPTLAFSAPSHGSQAEPVQTSSRTNRPSAEHAPPIPDWSSTVSNGTISKPVVAAPEDTPTGPDGEENNDVEPAPSDQSSSKGKSRATTVEDYVEDSA
ncbi:RING finger protein [Blastomyces gilchristii SLH14081]|uniref:RING-type E3 ubiquitin transferase n=1 Tax=Blastomyces gilchristii (strain SLH14081) TaxID=559298 RepID=A0A179UK06_BLAGS|nr:RING finger protein [Blastomyces gilchristii SLH14081]OAT08324.1 RING finger protein [Blastomyces gilchristii SLH14081]